MSRMNFRSLRAEMCSPLTSNGRRPWASSALAFLPARSSSAPGLASSSRSRLAVVAAGLIAALILLESTGAATEHLTGLYLGQAESFPDPAYIVARQGYRI